VFTLNEIQKYFKYRQSLIDQYVKGDMTKREYLSLNLEAVLTLRDKPFNIVDSLEKGLFNYQYFNALAKECKNIDPIKADYYYSKKDRATLSVLRILDFKGIEAYFIRVRSSALRGRLFEIIIQEYQMILHSASSDILERLRHENVFTEETRQSVIDGYINQRY